MSNINARLSVHTTIESAIAVLAVSERLVSKKWNKTSNNPAAFERHICIPFECVTASINEVGEQFKPLVDSALMSAAVSVLVSEIEEKGQSITELDLASFDRPRLIEAFLGAEKWLDKASLEKGFELTATWKRISTREEFKTNAQYKARAAAFKADILKLSAKNVSFTETAVDKILSVIDPADFDTECGNFIARRCADIKAKMVKAVVDFDGL